MPCEPLANRRHVSVTGRHTAGDYAHWLKELVDGHHPGVTLILNMHTPAALHAAVPPAEARRLLDTLDFRYTPKHGSRLNMAEIELSVLVCQYLSRRLTTPTAVGRAVAAQARKHNAIDGTVNWQFTIADTRIKPNSLYLS
jgi:hypothetical protein